jgi:hypothetical protein
MSCIEILGVATPREAVSKSEKEKASSIVIAKVRFVRLYGTMMFSSLLMLMMVENYVTLCTYYQSPCNNCAAMVCDEYWVDSVPPRFGAGFTAESCKCCAHSQTCNRLLTMWFKA